MSEGDDVGVKAVDNFVHSAAPIPAAKVAPMVGLVFEKLHGRLVPEIGPFDPAGAQILAEWLDRAKEFALLHGERGYLEVDRRAVLEQEQDFEQGNGVLAPGDAYGHAIAVPDHLKPGDRLANLAQECLFEVHSLQYTGRKPLRH